MAHFMRPQWLYRKYLPNPHGSNGYGQAFFKDILFAKWGISDFTDIDILLTQTGCKVMSADEHKIWRPVLVLWGVS